MMAQEPLAIESILSLMESVPITVIETTSVLSEPDFTRRIEADQWSILEIIAHLRASADIRGEQRITRMLREEEPTIRTESPRNAFLLESYAGVPFEEMVQAYSGQRTRLLVLLRALGSAEWNRGANLIGIRPQRYGTVQSEADALVRHEVRHLSQIKRTTELLQSKVERRVRQRQTGLVQNPRSLSRR